MKFKSFSKKYEFKKTALIRNFPSYLYNPISNWLWNILRSARLVDTTTNRIPRRRYLVQTFLDDLQITFREVFPQYWEETINFILSDPNRTADFIALCLQNYADSHSAGELEKILAEGGSAYEVTPTKKDATEYEEGVYDLSERVSVIVKTQSENALEANTLLQEAWQLCYSRNPDYEKSVIKCQNFLEHFLRDKYETENSKPQIGKLIGNLKSSPQKLKFKGETVLKNK